MRRESREAPLVLDDRLDLVTGEHLGEAWHAAGADAAGAVGLAVFRAVHDEVELVVEARELPDRIAACEVGTESAARGEVGLAVGPALGVAARAGDVEEHAPIGGALAFA